MWMISLVLRFSGLFSLELDFWFLFQFFKIEIIIPKKQGLFLYKKGYFYFYLLFYCEMKHNKYVKQHNS